MSVRCVSRTRGRQSPFVTPGGYGGRLEGSSKVWTCYSLDQTSFHRITILITRAHFPTCSDDGTIRYYGLCHGDQYEALERWSTAGRASAIHVTPGDPGWLLGWAADGGGSPRTGVTRPGFVCSMAWGGCKFYLASHAISTCSRRPDIAKYASDGRQRASHFTTSGSSLNCHRPFFGILRQRLP